MRPLRTLLLGVLGAGLVLAAAGCAALPRSDADKPAPPSLRTDIFTAAFENISERFLDPVSPRDMALTGIEGLGTLDPTLMVEVEGGRLVLSGLADDGPWTLGFDVPDDGNAAFWGGLTRKVAARARARSALLAEKDDERVYEAILDAVLSQLDRHSRYVGAEEAAVNRAKRRGYGGIGIRYESAAKGVRVIEVMPETPAALAGLQPDDVITHVEGQPLDGIGAKVVARLLRGEQGSLVRLAVAPVGGGPDRLYVLERRTIVPPTVEVAIENRVIVARVSGFNRRTAETLEREVTALLDGNERVKGLVLDLRGNPGGLLRQAVATADLFLDRGQIVATHGRHPDSLQTFSATPGDIAFGLPIAILIDGMSASASEVVAAALQDRGRAVVIGAGSFGKGTVQTVIRLPNDGEMTLTWSRMMAPTGYAIEGLGVPPIVCTGGTDPGRTPSEAEAEEILAEWRKAGPDQAERLRLRARCPAVRQGGGEPMRQAERILADPRVYTGLLGIVGLAQKPDR